MATQPIGMKVFVTNAADISGGGGGAGGDVSNFPDTVDTNDGNSGASTLRVVLATDQPQLTNALKVDGSATTQPVSGAVDVTPASPAANDYLPVRLTDGTTFYNASGGGSGGTQYTEDVASAGAESLMLAGTVRRDTSASSAGTDGDYATLNTDANGRLHVNGSGVTQPVSDNSGSLTVDAPVGTPAFVRLSDGTAAIATLPVNNAGTFAVQSKNVVASAARSNVSVTTTSGTVLASNGSRTDAVICNYGTVACFLSRSSSAVVGQGIYLAPDGAYSIDANNLYRGQITAITSSGTATLSVSEGS